MRHNLNFLGIEEPELKEGEYEDTENTLIDCLDKHENGIPYSSQNK